MYSTNRRGGKNWWGSSHFLSPHILCCLNFYSMVQRNSNKCILIYIGRGRFSHFLLQLSLSLGSVFPPPTLNMCSNGTCKSLHERWFDVLFKGISRVGVLFFKQSRYQPHWRRWETCQSLSMFFHNVMLSALGSCQISRRLGSWSMAPWNNKTW